MNTTCELLEKATEAAAREASERISALEQLRHAERLSTVGQLSGGIAHELGTPLNVIMARAQLILKDGAASPDVRKGAAIVLEQARRLTAIIRQLLDFARHRGARKSRQRLLPLARQTAGMLSSLAEKYSVALVVEGDESLAADVDPGQFQQALTNLVMNAIQASEREGTVTIRIGRTSSPPMGSSSPSRTGAAGSKPSTSIASSSRSSRPRRRARAQASACPWRTGSSRSTEDASTSRASRAKAPASPSVFPRCLLEREDPGRRRRPQHDGSSHRRSPEARLDRRHRATPVRPPSSFSSGRTSTSW